MKRKDEAGDWFSWCFGSVWHRNRRHHRTLSFTETKTNTGTPTPKTKKPTILVRFRFSFRFLMKKCPALVSRAKNRPRKPFALGDKGKSRPRGSQRKHERPKNAFKAYKPHHHKTPIPSLVIRKITGRLGSYLDEVHSRQPLVKEKHANINKTL